MIEYHNPDAEVGIEITPYELSANIKDAENVSIAFLANGFPDSENFLREVAYAMQAIEPAIKIVDYNKGNPTFPANDDMLENINNHCSAAVAAYGH